MRNPSKLLVFLILVGSGMWASVAVAEPPARAWHAFAGNGSTVANSSRLYLFGGSGSNWQALSDFWYYRVDTLTWTVAPTGSSKPGARAHAGFSCGAGQCVTSGGNNGVALVKETWTYTEATGTWFKMNCKRFLCPSARQMSTMAYDPSRSYHVLFGGKSSAASLRDTFTFTAGRWTARTPAAKPSARDRAAATFVAGIVNKIVLFGGQVNGASPRCDMWAWTGSTWQAISASNQGPCLHSHDMAWDGNRLIVTGGYVDTSDTPSHDVWHFDFSTASSGKWTKGLDSEGCYADVHPGARMAYDIPSRQKVFFGGEKNGPNGVIRYADTMRCD
jgi:hypothetical protein